MSQTLAVAPRHPAALQRRSLDHPWHTPRAEIVRLRGVPINRDAGEASLVRGPIPDTPVHRVFCSVSTAKADRDMSLFCRAFALYLASLQLPQRRTASQRAR